MKRIAFLFALVLGTLTTADAAALSAPSSAVATALSSSSIRLTWKDNSSKEIGFSVERSLSASGGFSLVAFTAANVAIYQDGSLAPSTTYYYRVRAVGRSLTSGYSNVASTRTLPTPTPTPSPTPPRTPSPTPTRTPTPTPVQVQLPWAKSFGGPGDDGGRAVATDQAGNILVAGVFEDSMSFGGSSFVSAGLHDIVVAKYNAAGAHLWSKQFGGVDEDVAYGLAVDAAGDVIVTGYFSGTVSFGGTPLTSAGGLDVFLVKLKGGDGGHVWSKRFGSSGDDFGAAVAVDGLGDVVLAGAYQQTVSFGGASMTSYSLYDVFVAEYTSGGQHLWSKGFQGSGSQFPYGVTVDGHGDVGVIGLFYNWVNFGGGNLGSYGGADIFVLKLAGGDGGHLWSKRFGSTFDDIGLSIAGNTDGSLVITGYFQLNVDFGGGVLASLSPDIFLAKFSATGQHLWSRAFGADGYDTGKSVTVDAAGNIVLTGSFGSAILDLGGEVLTRAGTAGSDVFVAEYTSAGTLVWSERYGAMTNDNAEGGSLGPNEVVVTGSKTGAGQSSDLLILGLP